MTFEQVLSSALAPPPLVALALGFLLLGVGGETLVRGAVSAAKALGVSPLLIGLTLVGFGTSAPELVTSLQAALVGSPGIAVGNVVGSNIANVLLILGLAAMIRPLAVDPKAFLRDGTALALITLVGVAVCLWGRMDAPLGASMVAALVLYVVVCYFTERTGGADAAAEKARHEADADRVAGPRPNVSLALLLAVVGIGVTVLGARYLVGGAVSIAKDFGVSDTLVGLTVVAVGTSLPELVTSLIAAIKRQSEVALGNVIGSNIYNLAGILGVTAIVEPLTVPSSIAQFDVWVMAAATALLVAFARSGWRIGRREGLAFLALYAAYTAWLGWSSGAFG